MTRRAFLAATAAATAYAQAPYPGVAYRDYFRCLPDFLGELARNAYERRNRELAKLTTPASIVARQSWARSTFWALVGGEPERSPLNTKIIGSFSRKGYRVEKLVFESQPGLHVPGLLYIPTEFQPPFPGVLFQMGHAPNGKAGATYQRCCQGLAKLGYLVLGFDPMGQGERIYYPGASPTVTSQGSPDGEHNFAGKQMLLTGDSSTRLQVWDAVRALDVLAAHPQVDPKRLASTGQSGGGTLTMFLIAADDRLATAAVCSGNTENFACKDWNAPGSTDDAEQNFPGSGPLGFDRWDLVYPFAPKPLLVSVSDKDFFGTYSPRYIANGWEEFEKLRKIYGTLGKPENLAWGGTPLPHGLSYDTRLLVYNWFARWLRNETKPITEEPPVALEPDETLWITNSGNVRELEGRSPFQVNRARAVPSRQVELASFLGIVAPPVSIKPKVIKRIPTRGGSIEILEIASASGVWIPAWLYLPAKTPDYCITVLQTSGRLTQWHEDELFHNLALRGHAVCVPDLRGVGDLAPEIGRGAARHARDHANEEDYAWASLILGKPLVGQRATDILATLAALRNYPPVANLEMRVAAQNRMTVPAQIAASLDSAIKQLYLTGGLASFRQIVETENYTHAFANFVPGFLSVTDLPAINLRLAPRRVVLSGAVDGAGQPMPADRVRALHPNAPHIHMNANSAWDVASLES